ncbi:hypothetical protein PV327_000513 [Microctonus hyperodae]|uniref:Small ribosomal subunit protein mS31 n=1 Tax=Microctonus hyperodae TaxID=165561 RepID=A0AA39L285_MICHY|nr:hypothetical protein PV327_000513 [Microctonus hyperodae]
MNRLIMMRFITRHTVLSNQQLHTSVRLLNSNDSSSSSDSSDSDNEKPANNRQQSVSNENKEKLKQNTVDLLNSLLTKMSTNQSEPKTMDRAIPKKKPFPKPVRQPSLEEKLKSAAKNAAESLGGDVKKNEAELLDKIFSAGAPIPAPKDSENSSKSSSQSSLRDLFAGMKIDSTPQKESLPYEGMQMSRRPKIQELARKFQQIDTRFTRERPTKNYVAGNLYDGKPLNIFDPVTQSSDDESTLETWKLLEKKELDLMMLHPPSNIIEEMIQWTDKGLLWKFPIDNEIGLDEEKSIHFSEHVFMDRHLRGWCPKGGPIRHFMELVCVGLSKNPYMTVQEKKDHIMWYRDFFGSKQELLKEIGAIQHDILPSDTKQIES